MSRVIQSALLPSVSCSSGLFCNSDGYFSGGAFSPRLTRPVQLTLTSSHTFTASFYPSAACVSFFFTVSTVKMDFRVMSWQTIKFSEPPQSPVETLWVWRVIKYLCFSSGIKLSRTPNALKQRRVVYFHLRLPPAGWSANTRPNELWHASHKKLPTPVRKHISWVV